MVRKYFRENLAGIGFILMLLISFFLFSRSLITVPDIAFPGSDDKYLMLSSNLRMGIHYFLVLVFTTPLIPYTWKYNRFNSLWAVGAVAMMCIPWVIDGILILAHVDHINDAGTWIVSWTSESEYRDQVWIRYGRYVYLGMTMVLFIWLGRKEKKRVKELKASLA